MASRCRDFHPRTYHFAVHDSPHAPLLCRAHRVILCRYQRAMLEMLNVVQRETDVPRWGTDRVFDTFWYMEQRRDGAVLIPANAIKEGPVYLVLGMAQSIGSLLPPPPVQVGSIAW